MTRIMILMMLIFAAVPAAYAQDVLCPDEIEGGATTAMKALPESMGGVQADIERYTLCIERARLLQMLDSVMVTREETLRKMREGDTGSIAGITGVPPLPAGSLPPVSGVNPASVAKADGTSVVSAAPNPLEAATASLQVDEWKTRKIWGQGLGIRAQLSNGGGTLLNVAKGDPLPDGGMVEDISIRGVTISRNGKSKDLSWEQVTEEGNS
jgi:hypothetical protein